MKKRLITSSILQGLANSPVVLLNGARQVGKSTLAQWLTENGRQAAYYTLDDPTILSAIHNDPTTFLNEHQEPLILDEVQRAPELFLALKVQVDKKRTAGRYLLTGSANVLLLPKLSESLAGRMDILTIYPFSQSEIAQTKGEFIDSVFAEKMKKFVFEKSGKKDLYDRIVSGGFPEMQKRTNSESRSQWFASYVTSVLQRDIRDITHIEGLTLFPRLLSLLAARSGALMNIAELSNSSAIPQTTLKRYLTLLEMTYLVHTVPAWSVNLSKRIIKTPKVYLADTGLMAYLQGVDVSGLKTDSTRLGQFVESFVMNELKSLSSWSKIKPRLYHYRTAKGHEIDFLLERRDGTVVAIEVKSSTTVDASAFKTLEIFADDLKKKFLRGIVLYSGKEVVPFGKSMYAIPIQSLWH